MRVLLNPLYLLAAISASACDTGNPSRTREDFSTALPKANSYCFYSLTSQNFSKPGEKVATIKKLFQLYEEGDLELPPVSKNEVILLATICGDRRLESALDDSISSKAATATEFINLLVETSAAAGDIN